VLVQELRFDLQFSAALRGYRAASTWSDRLPYRRAEGAMRGDGGGGVNQIAWHLWFTSGRSGGCYPTTRTAARR